MLIEAEHVNILFIEKALNKQLDPSNLKRNIKITVPNLISALEVIRDTDYLAIVPRCLATSLNEKKHFVIKTLPFPKKILPYRCCITTVYAITNHYYGL